MFPVFHLAWSTCPATKTLLAGWRKLLRKEERGSTLSNKFWLCCSFFINSSRNKFARILANQLVSAPHFFNPQQKHLLRVKLIKQGEKRETSTKTATKQCFATSWGFLYLVFRRLYLRISRYCYLSFLCFLIRVNPSRNWNSDWTKHLKWKLNN